MQPRKLIRLGNSSFAIALPKDWVDKSGLKKGDEIFLERNANGEISIFPTFQKEEEKKIEINLDKKDPEIIKKHLHAAYVKGYNTLIFKGASKDTKILKNLLNDYVSFEIIDSNSEQTIVKDFFDFKEAKYDNFVRRIDNNLRELFELVIAEVLSEKANPRVAKDIEEIDKEVNKFYFLCSRIFIRGIDNPTILNALKMSGNRLFNSWWISFHLESLGDGLKYVYKWINKINPEEKQVIQDFLTRINNEYLSCMDAFYKDDTNKAFDVLTNIKKIKHEIEDMADKSPKNIKIWDSIELVRKNVYQNAKMIFYMRY